MSKLQTVLSLAAVLLFANIAEAQSCRNGFGPINSRYGDDYTRANYDSGYGYSRFQTPVGYTGGTCSFSQACRECGRTHTGPPSRWDGYEPVRANFGVSGRARFNEPAVCRDCNDPNCRCDVTNFGRSNYRPNEYDRNFGTGDFGRTRNEWNDPRYRPTGGFDGGYNYTSTRPPISTTVRWQSDLRQAAEMARRNRRPMLVTVTAPWCSYCTKMKNETFRSSSFVRTINTGDIIPVMIDADTNAELVARLGIKSLPTTLTVSPDLKIAERMEGFRSAEQLTQSLTRLGRSAKLDTTRQVALR